MSLYYLHSHYDNYKRYGIYEPEHGQKPPSATKLYADQKKFLLRMVNGLRGNKNEAKKLSNFLNLTHSPEPGQVQADAAAFEEYRKAIGERINQEVSQSLTLANKESLQDASARLRESLRLEDEAIKEVFSFSTSQGSLPFVSVNRAIKRIQIAWSQLDKNSKMFQQFEQDYKIIKQYAEQLSKYATGTKRKSYILPEVESTTQIKKSDFINALNALMSHMSYGTVANDIGKIGELFGAASVYRYFHHGSQGTQQLVLDFIKGVKTKGLQITGDDKSSKVFTDSLGTTYVGAKNRTASKDGTYYHLNLTDDKVDFMVTTPGGETYNFSAKNYARPSTITILSGNIYPILEENRSYLYHFLNTLTFSKNSQYSDQQSNIATLYKGAKQLVGIRALIGGVRALSTSGQLIQTATADYLYVINNTTGKIDVMSTKELATHILNDVTVLSMRPDFNQYRYANSTNESSRFQGITVELHLAKLKKSLGD